MKSLNLRFVCLAVLLMSSLYLFQSCSKEKTDIVEDVYSENGLILKSGLTYGETIEFPAGTNLKIEGQNLKFSLPSEYRLIAEVQIQQTESDVVNLSSGYLRCSCDLQNCSPYIQGNTAGCSGNTNTLKISSDVSLGFSVLQNAIIVNMNEPTKLIASSEERASILSSKDFIFEDEEVINKLSDFVGRYTSEADQMIMKNYNDEDQLPENFEYIAVNFLNSQIRIPLNVIENPSVKIGSVGTKKGSCKCNSFNTSTFLDGCRRKHRRTIGSKGLVINSFNCKKTHCDDACDFVD